MIINTGLQAGASYPFAEASRFNGFPEKPKPLKRLVSTTADFTGLTAGVRKKNKHLQLPAKFWMIAVNDGAGSRFRDRNVREDSGDE
jgi:hypothetical protein